MPPLNEGSLLYMPVLHPKTGLKEIQRVMSWQDTVLASVPEIETVAGKLGRFETPTDPAPTQAHQTQTQIRRHPTRPTTRRHHWRRRRRLHLAVGDR